MIYLLYGEETYKIEEELKKIVSNFGSELITGINYVKIDDSNLNNLISDIETPAFGYPKKLIVARKTGLFKNPNDVITEYFKTIKIDDSVDIVFVEESVSKNTVMYKTISQIGKVKEFKELSEKELIAEIGGWFSKAKINITQNDIYYFIECVGTNMQDIMSEIGKLVRYAGIGGTITKKDIDDLCIKKLDSYIFDMTNAMADRNIKKALEILNNMIYMKEPIPVIMVNLYNQIRRLYLTKLCVKYGKDIVTNLKLKPNQTFLVGKLKMQASKFTEQELEELLMAIIQLDRNYKIGKIDPEIGIQAVIARYV